MDRPRYTDPARRNSSAITSRRTYGNGRACAAASDRSLVTTAHILKLQTGAARRLRSSPARESLGTNYGRSHVVPPARLLSDGQQSCNQRHAEPLLPPSFFLKLSVEALPDSDSRDPVSAGEGSRRRRRTRRPRMDSENMDSCGSCASVDRSCDTRRLVASARVRFENDQWNSLWNLHSQCSARLQTRTQLSLPSACGKCDELTWLASLERTV